MSGVLFSKATMTTDVYNHLEPNRPLFQSGWLAPFHGSRHRRSTKAENICGSCDCKRKPISQDIAMPGVVVPWIWEIFSFFGKLANLEVGGVGNFRRKWWPVFLSGWSLEIISMTFAVFQRRKAVISVFYHSLELEKPTRYLSQVGSKTSLTFLFSWRVRLIDINNPQMD